MHHLIEQARRPDMQTTFTVAELARALDTTEAAIRGLIQRDSLPVVKRWGRLSITLPDAEVLARKRGIQLHALNTSP
jgi:hypothetical protein